jgi:hypothetical protein
MPLLSMEIVQVDASGDCSVKLLFDGTGVGDALLIMSEERVTPRR